MKIETVTAANVLSDQTIELTTTDPLTGAETKRRYLAIRGGISWPTTKAPAYFCIVGQEIVSAEIAERNPVSDSGNRVLLAEYESDALSMGGFYCKLVDTGTMLGCREFYVTMPEEQWECGFLHDFTGFCRARGGDIRLLDAIDKDNFLLGVSRIKQGLDSGQLAIPRDSIVFSQMQDLTRQDLEDSPDQRLHAINGVRHALGSFHRFPPTVRNRRGSKTGKLDWRAF